MLGCVSLLLAAARPAYFSKTEWLASQRQPRVDLRIAGGEARMLFNLMCHQDPARPPNPLVAATLGEVENRGLRDKEAQIDSCLLGR